MKKYPKQKTDKEFQISVADASSNPRTVMIMLLDADTTRRAVKRARWSKDLAGLAIPQSVVGFLRVDDIFVTPAVLLERHR